MAEFGRKFRQHKSLPQRTEGSKTTATCIFSSMPSVTDTTADSVLRRNPDTRRLERVTRAEAEGPALEAIDEGASSQPDVDVSQHETGRDGASQTSPSPDRENDGRNHASDESDGAMSSPRSCRR